MTQTTVEPAMTRAAPRDRQARARRTWYSVVGAWVPAAVGVGLLGYAVSAGLPVGSAVQATLAVVVTQMLPGVLAWRAVRPRNGWWLEDLSIGFAIGAAIAVGAQTVAGLTGLRWIAGLVGITVAAGLLGVPATRQRIAAARTAPLPWWWGPAVSVLSLAAVLQVEYFFRRVPMGWPDGARTMDVDAAFHLAVAGELANRGPESFSWVLGEPLAYHWFSHAWIAQISTVSGAGLDTVLFRFMPALMPLAVAIGVGIAAVRLTGRYYPGPVAASITMVTADVNVFGHFTLGEAVAPLSPSLGFSAVALISLVVVLGVRWQGRLGRGGLVLIPLLTLLTAGAKGSAAPLVVAGLVVCALAMAVFDRSRLRTVLTDLVITAGCLLVAMFTVIRGSDAGLHLDLIRSARSTWVAGWMGGLDAWPSGVLAVGVALAAMLSRGAAGTVLVGIRETRREPIVWLLLGGGLAGAGAAVAFIHPGQSQYYFARSAVPLLALASALGVVVMVTLLGGRIWRPVVIGVVAGPVITVLLPALLGRLDPESGVWHAVVLLAVAANVLAAAGLLASRKGGRIAAAAAVAFGVLAGGIAIYPTGQWTIWSTPQALPVPPAAHLAVSRDQIDAARWLRDHSAVDDIVMTNRHCTRPVPPVGTKPVACDSRRFVVAGFAERQVLVEGWRYTTTANRLAVERGSAVVDYWQPDVLELNDRFIARPDRRAADRLRGLGVRWVFVDHTGPHAATLEPYAALRFQNSSVDVYELR